MVSGRLVGCFSRVQRRRVRCAFVKQIDQRKLLQLMVALYLMQSTPREEEEEEERGSKRRKRGESVESIPYWERPFASFIVLRCIE